MPGGTISGASPWSVPYIMSETYSEEIKRKARVALQERFEALESNISYVARKLEQLRKDFGNRILNLENYIIDKEISRILPNLVIVSPNIKITTFRDYNIPILEIDDNHLSSCLSVLNQIYYCDLEIFFLIKYKGYFYKYSNTISPLDYILSDLEKWKSRYDYDGEKIHGNIYYFFSENGVNYFNKITENSRGYGNEYMNDERSYNMNMDSYSYEKLSAEEEESLKLSLPNYNDGDFHFTVYQDTISLPTQSLLQKWLRETHNIHITVDSYHCLGKPKPFGLAIDYLHESGKWDYLDYRGDTDFETYEEALEKGLVEGLKLIKN